MSISKIRSMLYFTAKILGDVQAATSGKPDAVTKRIGRRLAGKVTGRLIGKIFR